MKSLVFVVLLCWTVAGGCAPWATYPHEEGTFNLSSARSEPVPSLMTEAIRYTRGHYGKDGEFAINLPRGTPPEVYKWVIRRLGGGHPMADPDEPTYHVAKVMARGTNSKVDVFYPTDTGYAFATISFQWDLMRGYRHVNTRVWLTADQPPPPHYVPHLAGTVQEPVASDAPEER